MKRLHLLYRPALTVCFAACLALLAAGCDVNDPIYNTPHPDRGAVTVTADWAERDENIPIPTTYTVELNGATTVVSSDFSALSGLFAPGAARLSAWNMPQGFIIADGKATLAPAAGSSALASRDVALAAGDATPASRDVAAASAPGTASASDAPALFTSRADWLFTGGADVTILADDTLHANLSMHRRMRLLRFELTVTEGEYDRITSISATLSGIATTIDLRTGALTDAATVSIALSRTGNKITGEARLPGISAPAAQELSVTLSFEGNEPPPQTTRSDLSTQLADFNDGKLSTIILKGNLRSPISVDTGSTVIDWASGNGDGEEGSAGM